MVLSVNSSGRHTPLPRHIGRESSNVALGHPFRTRRGKTCRDPFESWLAQQDYFLRIVELGRVYPRPNSLLPAGRSPSVAKVGGGVCALLERVDQRARREQIAALLATRGRLSGDPIPRPPRTPLVIDGTGVGRAVADQFREAGLGPRLTTIAITAGGTVTAVGPAVGVPKRDLVATLQVVFQSKRLRIANDLKMANAFVTEMLAFRVKLSATGHDSYGAEPGEHDDLVLAVGVALWHAEWLRTTARRINPKAWKPIHGPVGDAR
jgi:hypothetical protein